MLSCFWLFVAPNLALAGDNSESSYALTLTVPANGDDNFPLNGNLWLYGKKLDLLPQEVMLPDGYGVEEVPPWEQNPDVSELWREPRRAQWRRSSVQRRLRTLSEGIEGVALVRVDSGIGVAVELSTYGAVYRPPLRFAADGTPIERAVDNVYDLLVANPLESLEPETDYALLVNGDLSVFTTAQVDDITPPEWAGIEEVTHLGDENTVYTLASAADDFSFPVMVELYRGEARSPRLRQFALVGTRPVTGRLSPLNQDCIFARSVDVAGNYTDLLPCYPYPDPPEEEVVEETFLGCGVVDSSPNKGSKWSLVLLAALLVRVCKENMTCRDRPS